MVVRTSVSTHVLPRLIPRPCPPRCRPYVGNVMWTFSVVCWEEVISGGLLMWGGGQHRAALRWEVHLLRICLCVNIYLLSFPCTWKVDIYPIYLLFSNRFPITLGGLRPLFFFFLEEIIFPEMGSPVPTPQAGKGQGHPVP